MSYRIVSKGELIKLFVLTMHPVNVGGLNLLKFIQTHAKLLIGNGVGVGLAMWGKIFWLLAAKMKLKQKIHLIDAILADTLGRARELLELARAEFTELKKREQSRERQRRFRERKNEKTD